MRFKVKDSNLFRMPNNPNYLHLATISYGLQEFVAFVCIAGSEEDKGKCYIEKVTLSSYDPAKMVWANLEWIEDDNLAFDLAKFCEDKGLTDIPKRLNELGDTGRLGWITGNNAGPTSLA